MPKLVISRTALPKANKVVKSKTVKSDTISGFMAEVTRLGSDPTVILTLGVVAFLALNHEAESATSFLSKLVKWLVDNPTTASLGKWLQSHMQQLVGAMVLGITALMVSPQNKRGVYTGLAAGAGFVIPESHAWQYIVQAGALVLWMRARRPDVRVMVLAITVGLYVGGLLIKQQPTSVTNRSHEPQAGSGGHSQSQQQHSSGGSGGRGGG